MRPAKSTAYSSSWPVRSELNAISVPSGDQLGVPIDGRLALGRNDQN
jgi:hypothetical protein